MKPKGAGAVQDLQTELTPDWHLSLTDHQLAAYIRYQFIRHHEKITDWNDPAHNKTRPRWDGGTDNFGVKHTSVWATIGGKVRSYNADPGLWVQAHFSPVSYNHKIAETHSLPDIRPNNLCASRSVEIFSEYRARFPQILRTGLNVAGETIANRFRGTASLNMRPDDQAFYVLCDENYVTASSFFRSVFATQMDCQRAVERYLWRAAIDYDAQQRIYDVALCDEQWCFSELLQAALQDVRNHWRAFA
jgi:hypothetical protein